LGMDMVKASSKEYYFNMLGSRQKHKNDIGHYILVSSTNAEKFKLIAQRTWI
jgi:hypothetical protein